MESTIGHLTRHVRTLRANLASMHAVVWNLNMCFGLRLRGHASWLMNRFPLCASGQRAFWEAFDSEWKETCVFSEIRFFSRKPKATMEYWLRDGDAAKLTLRGIVGCGLVVTNKETNM